MLSDPASRRVWLYSVLCCLASLPMSWSAIQLRRKLPLLDGRENREIPYKRFSQEFSGARSGC